MDANRTASMTNRLAQEKEAAAELADAHSYCLLLVLNMVTAPSVIDLAEDRDLFREMMEKLEIPMPEAGMAVDVEEALEIAEKIGYPVMVRPSYVLGGRGMEVVYDDESMTEYMKAAVGVTPDRPILIDRFLNVFLHGLLDRLFRMLDLHLIAQRKHGVVGGDVIQHRLFQLFLICFLNRFLLVW